MYNTPTGRPAALLIDVSNLFFRSFFAVPQSFMTPDGQPCNAVYGVASIVLGLVEELEPQALYAARDIKGGTIRHTKLDSYKEGRPEMPDLLRGQLPMIFEFFDQGMGVPLLGLEGYEADDIIATLATRLKDDYQVYILSADRDLLQLAQESITILIPKGKENLRVDPRGVMEMLGVRPEQVPDYKALAGDSSDKLVGVPGIGPKGATQLLQKYDTLAQIIMAAAANEIPGRMGSLINEHRDSALLCYELAHLHTDLHVKDEILEAGKIGDGMPDGLEEFLAKISSRRLIRRAQKAFGSHEQIVVADGQGSMF